jgi:hypothetical protein
MAVRTQSPVKRQHSGALSTFIFYPEDEGSISLSNFGGSSTRPLPKYHCDTLKFHKNKVMSKHTSSFITKQQVMKQHTTD